MKLYIKNMVCNRCIAAVRSVLEEEGLHPVSIQLGEVEIGEEIPEEQKDRLSTALKHLGFELIDNRQRRIIEKVKNLIVRQIHHSGEELEENLSDFISRNLHFEYSYISGLFSEVEGTTIEKYFITQKIEKVKELLIYDELTLSEIASRLGYSSVAHLSAQFKKVTGLTPTFYKSMKEHKRRNIDDI